MSKSARGFVIAVVAIGVVLFLFIGGDWLFDGNRETISFSQFESESASKEIKSANWQDQTIKGTRKDGTRFEVRVPDVESEAGRDLLGSLRFLGVDIKLVGPSKSALIIPIIGMLLLPLIIVVGFYFIFIRPAPFVLPKNVDQQHKTEDRLRAAQLLLESGKITQDEYDKMRERILEQV